MLYAIIFRQYKLEASLYFCSISSERNLQMSNINFRDVYKEVRDGTEKKWRKDVV